MGLTIVAIIQDAIKVSFINYCAVEKSIPLNEEWHILDKI